jgi:hypothetical protein
LADFDRSGALSVLLEVDVVVELNSVGEKTMVSPLCAAVMVARSDPAPLS